MQNQDDVLGLLAQHESLSTFQFREILGIYPRSLMNNIIAPAGLAEKFIQGRNIHWRITDLGKQIIVESEVQDETALTPEIIEKVVEISKEIGVIEEPEKEKTGWLKRLRKKKKN